MTTQEFARLLPAYLFSSSSSPPHPSSFYARTHHPAFNLDVDDAQDALVGFSAHTKAVGNSMEGLRAVYGSVREARVEMSKAERMMSYALLDLITSSSLGATQNSQGTMASNNDEEGGESLVDRSTRKGKTVDMRKGLVNADGAWCWRDECKGKPIPLAKGCRYCVNVGLRRVSTGYQGRTEGLRDAANRGEFVRWTCAYPVILLSTRSDNG